MAKDMFDQVKFYIGLGVFLYSIYSIWGVKQAGLTPFGLGLPDFLGGGGGPGSGPAVRSTPNCDSATNMCACPNGDVFQMGQSRTCADCTVECNKRGGGGGGPTVDSNVGFYYGRPVRDHGLDWELTGWERSEAVNRLTVA